MSIGCIEGRTDTLTSEKARMSTLYSSINPSFSFSLSASREHSSCPGCRHIGVDNGGEGVRRRRGLLGKG